MIREVELASYLPPFMQNCEEPVAALDAEDPEFRIVWTAADRCLRNRFISTADEYGISRFEKMLNIYPSEGDTIEFRRARVKNQWNMTVPYTIRRLTKMLVDLIGEDDFTVYGKFSDGYELNVTVYTDDRKAKELDSMLSEMVPMNVLINVTYEKALEGCIYIGGFINEADILELKQR